MRPQAWCYRRSKLERSGWSETETIRLCFPTFIECVEDNLATLSALDVAAPVHTRCIAMMPHEAMR